MSCANLGGDLIEELLDHRADSEPRRLLGVAETSSDPSRGRRPEAPAAAHWPVLPPGTLQHVVAITLRSARLSMRTCARCQRTMRHEEMLVVAR